MKKVLLMAAIFVAGIVSANTVYDKANNSGFVLLDAEIEQIASESDHYGIMVETWCGKVFYLDGNHYENFTEFGADANYFTDQQCGAF
ncbi:MAG TPA: hypothetical protein DCW95_07570 [Chryseobacterium sp.]|nr:hypothetical protein [Chryseobacterium sp.]